MGKGYKVRSELTGARSIITFAKPTKARDFFLPRDGLWSWVSDSIKNMTYQIALISGFSHLYILDTCQDQITCGKACDLFAGRSHLCNFLIL